MKSYNKGFTLIELLAVIVILAIIALITTPTILNVIEDSRKNAAVDKAWGTIEAAKTAYAQAQVKDEVGVPYTVYFSGSGSKTDTTTGGGAGTGQIKSVQVTASGEMPTAGWITIKADGSLIASDLTYGNYHCSTIASANAQSFNANKMYCSRTQSEVTAAKGTSGTDYISR